MRFLVRGSLLDRVGGKGLVLVRGSKLDQSDIMRHFSGISASPTISLPRCPFDSRFPTIVELLISVSNSSFFLIIASISLLPFCSVAAGRHENLRFIVIAGLEDLPPSFVLTSVLAFVLT